MQYLFIGATCGWWWGSVSLQNLICAALPFCALVTELHFVLNSVWQSAPFTVYGILLLSVILSVLIACVVAVGLVYVQLNAEDHR